MGSTAFFTVIKFWIDKTSGVALELNTGVPSYHVDDEEGQNAFTDPSANRGGTWRPLVPLAARAEFDSRSIFEVALVDE
jgi:hypothetical protein